MRPYPARYGTTPAGQPGAAPPCGVHAPRRRAEPAIQHHGGHRRRHHRRGRGARRLRRQGAAGAPHRRTPRERPPTTTPSGNSGEGTGVSSPSSSLNPPPSPPQVRLVASAGHERIELMAEADARTDNHQRVYRTHALGTIAELVTDAGALFEASRAARARARAHRPRGQPVPRRLGAQPAQRRRRY